MLKNYKPIIGIIGIPSVDDEGDTFVALYTNYNNAILKKGGIPFMIAPFSDINYVDKKLSEIPELSEEEKKNYRDLVNMCDGLVIPGGYRIYNFAKYISEYAIERNIPILGICMGMQTLATVDNGHDCVAKNDTPINHRQKENKYVHNVEILENTLLSNIVEKQKIPVNSKHRYHVNNTKKFIVSSYSEDGLIESIELPNKRFVIGIQWHPEKMLEYDESANKIFDRFIRECKES